MGMLSVPEKGCLKLNSTQLSTRGSQLGHMVPIYLMVAQVFDRL